MPDDILPFDKTTEPGLSRRSFGFALGAGVAVTASAVAADNPVVETDVMIKMTDGDCDAALFHPSGSGSWAGAVIFTDALGLRPASAIWGDSSQPRATPFSSLTRFTEPERRRCAHSGDHERSIRSIMNTESGDHEHALAII